MSDLISFSIRNKSKTPIVTYSKKTMELFLKSHPETIPHVLSAHSKSYEYYAGKPLTLDHAQNLILLKHFGADENGYWHALTKDLPLELKNVCWIYDNGLSNSYLVKTLEQIYTSTEAFYTVIFNAANLKRERND